MRHNMRATTSPEGEDGARRLAKAPWIEVTRSAPCDHTIAGRRQEGTKHAHGICVAFPRPVLVGCRAARVADRSRGAEKLRCRDHRRWVCWIVGGTDACPGRPVGCRAR